MQHQLIKPMGKLAVLAATLGFAATMFAAPPAQASCEGQSRVFDGENDGPISYRLERWTGTWAHRTNCRVVVPVEQVFAWAVDAAF